MFLLWIVLGVLVTGVVAKLGIDYVFRDAPATRPGYSSYGYYEPPKITWFEYAIGAVICLLLIVPLTLKVGTSLARSSKLTYHEYYNGLESGAHWQKVQCSRDGPCGFEYDCDPYNHVHHESRTVSDGNGGTRTEYYTEDHTHYHSCPYTTEEWVFSIATTIDDIHVGRFIPTDPKPWRSGKGIPNLPQGVPRAWQEVKDRLDAKDPAGVTFRKDYDNYILASQHTILKRYGGLVDDYLAKGLLPKVVTNVHSYYWADKVYFVGTKPDGRTQQVWQRTVTDLNGYLGGELRGDLHVVVVNPGVIPITPDDYFNALMAYWQGPKLGKNAISKNAIIVVLGTDGATVTWARAGTGMPLGNEALMLDIKNTLTGKPLEPLSLIGDPIYHNKNHTTGLLESVLWGEHKFERVCMTCKEEKKVGYTYLNGEIQPSTGQRWAMGIAAWVLSGIAWLILAFGAFNTPSWLSNLIKKKETE